MQVKSPSDNRYHPIKDYALIGDTRCAALVSRHGAIDWLCLPRFDSPAVFGALLDAEIGGTFQIRPEGDFTIQRNYIDNTNVLETVFSTASGKVRLTDCMPVYTEEYMRARLCPQRHILRKIECLRGEAAVNVTYRPTSDIGKRAYLKKRNALGIYCNTKNGTLILSNSGVSMRLSDDRSAAQNTFMLNQGQTGYFSLVFTDGEPAVLPMLGEESEYALRRTIKWWRQWTAKCTFAGPFRDAVIRSFLTLKMLSFSPSGAVIAAPTTSLPEKIGGVRNWDYRYCWLRDAAMTIRAFIRLGYKEEGEAFLAWILHTTRLSRPELKVLYDVYGEPRIREKKLAELEGYAGSRPVRKGNNARNQLQLDVYGEVVVAVFEYVRSGGELDRATRRMLLSIGKTICRRWHEPDEGIWELQSGRRHNTYSKAMCWVALDLMIKMHAAGNLPAPTEQYRAAREAIRKSIESHGYSEDTGSYRSCFEESSLDGSLLLLPIYGYVRPDDERMVSTCRQIEAALGKNGLIYRYTFHDGLPPGEGAFGACSFWAVQCGVLRGEVSQAKQRFVHLLGFANDVGLFSEEIDAQSGAALGNFPQAFTHVALINAAMAISQREKKETAA